MPTSEPSLSAAVVLSRRAWDAALLDVEVEITQDKRVLNSRWPAPAPLEFSPVSPEPELHGAGP